MSEVAQIPVIRLSVSREIGQGHQIVLESYVANDQDPNPLLDKLNDAVGRQMARHELPQLERMLAQRMKEHQRAIEDMERIDRAVEARDEEGGQHGRRKSQGRTAAERIDREKAMVSIERWKQEALELQEQITHRKVLLKGGV